MASTGQGLAVVFSGGGCTTFWSLGAWQRIRDVLPPVTEWAGVSAGSAMACAVAVDRAEETLEDFCVRTAANRSNVYPLNVLGHEPVFPHEAIYRATVHGALDEGGFEALGRAAPLRILLARFTGRAGTLRTILSSVRAYRRRKRRWVLHGPGTPHPGLEVQVRTAQDCASPGELCDLVLASSCTPPITRVQVIDGSRYADGALVDHAPVRALSRRGREGPTIVFSTMAIPRDRLPDVRGRLYMAPGRPVPISIWDYAHPNRVRETFAMGYADAEGFLRPLEAFLEKLDRVRAEPPA